jgi:hypothetical protein
MDASLANKHNQKYVKHHSLEKYQKGALWGIKINDFTRKEINVKDGNEKSSIPEFQGH